MPYGCGPVTHAQRSVVILLTPICRVMIYLPRWESRPPCLLQPRFNPLKDVKPAAGAPPTGTGSEGGEESQGAQLRHYVQQSAAVAEKYEKVRCGVSAACTDLLLSAAVNTVGRKAIYVRISSIFLLLFVFR